MTGYIIFKQKIQKKKMSKTSIMHTLNNFMWRMNSDYFSWNLNVNILWRLKENLTEKSINILFQENFEKIFIKVTSTFLKCIYIE